jgi:hypothetical protein
MKSAPTKPAAPVPPALRQYELWIAVVFVMPALGAVAAPFVMWRVSPWISPLWALPAIPIVIATTTAGTIWYTRRHKTRMKRAVVAASGNACIGCVYDLRGMGETGACPECGRSFDIAVNQRSWQQAGMLEERTR